MWSAQFSGWWREALYGCLGEGRAGDRLAAKGAKEVQLFANVEGRWGRSCLKLGGPAQLGVNLCNSDTETALDLGDVSTVADVSAFIEMIEVGAKFLEEFTRGPGAHIRKRV